MGAPCVARRKAGEKKGIEVWFVTGEELNRRLEVQVDGVWLQADVFGEGGPYARRLVVAVKDAELRDCAVRPGSTFHKWRKVLSVHTTCRRPRDASACLLKVPLLGPRRVCLLAHVAEFILNFSFAPSDLCKF